MNPDCASSRRWSSQRGQTFIAFAIFICLFLVGALGLVTDYSQLLAHRQMAQGAADAACEAGAADLYLQYNSPTPPSGISYGWIGSNGTKTDCSIISASPPCWYASQNGYSGSNVAVSFLSTFSGAPSLSGFTVSHPFIRVTITDQVPMSFTRLFANSSTQPVTATAYCGVNPVSTPGSLPMLVLDPTDSHIFTVQGGASIAIIGGANPAIVVDSSSTSALQLSGSNAVNLQAAGPSGNGSNFNLVANVPSEPAGITLGNGKWVSPASVTADPWQSIPAPSEPASPGTANPVLFATDGCPDPAGCVEFAGGDYSNCITQNNSTQNHGVVPGQNFCLQVKSNTTIFGATAIWQASQAYPAGSWIQPTQQQGNQAGYIFKAIQGGTSGATLADWQASHQYANGSRIQPTQGNGGNFIFTAIQAGTGTSGASNNEPHWPNTVGAQVTDGTVTWQASLMWPQTIGTTVTDGTVIWQTYPFQPNTGIFAPGLYYLGNTPSQAFDVEGSATVRTSTAVGDNSLGVTIYFSGTSNSHSINVNSAGSPLCTGLSATSGVGNQAGCVFAYNTTDNGGSGTTAPSTWSWAPAGGFVLHSQPMQCPGGAANPSQVPPTLNGNTLLGPCAAGPNFYGNGTGTIRGFLFFESHSSSVQPNFSGSGALLISGFMYFHNSSCPANNMCTQFTITGGSGAGSYGYGEIVADQINVQSGTFTMILSSSDSTTTTLRPQLLH